MIILFIYFTMFVENINFMQKVSYSFLMFFALLFSDATIAQDVERPKLVVGVMVDQMRWDYLYRYYDRYGENGFKRLLRQGFSMENTYIDYLPTYTAVGHTSVYTGSVPAIHGIAGNDFVIQSNGKHIYCTEDNEVEGVGTTAKAGQMSPKNLLTSTVGDELRLATNFQSKIIGIALKDRASILPGGRFANAAYWLDSDSGDFITSSFYMNDLPKWVKKFNRQNLAKKYLSQNWKTLYDINTYMQSIEDNNPYEEKYKGADAPVFEVDMKKMMKESGVGTISSVTFGNDFTLDFAKAAIEEESLGNNPAGVPDFLALSLSSPDYIGHRFGPTAIEIEDTYLRLDTELANFMAYLDETVGEGEYLLFLTADHGAAHNPQFMKDKGAHAGYFNTAEAHKKINEVLEKEFGHTDIARSSINYQVHLDYDLIEKENLDIEAIKTLIIRELLKMDKVAFAVDQTKAITSSVPQPIRDRIVNGYNSKRSGEIQYVLEPQHYGGREGSTGTTHGTWGPYDSHIPLIFMGWGVASGESHRTVHMTDIASTIAAFLKIQEPNGNIGKPILEVLESKK